MGQIKVTKNLGGIAGLCLIEPTLHGDERGYFLETYSRRDMEENGLFVEFVQDNRSMSTKGVLRGLHFQKRYAQTKLVHVVQGAVFDVAVDLRPGSPSFGKWHGEVLSGENNRQLLIPRGFAHGYLVLSEKALFCYKCDDFYHPNDEGGLAWNDPEIGVCWPGLEGEYRGTARAEGYRVLGAPLVLSEKDQNWPGIGSLR